ncbi:YkgJ family cysteine cluster protein [Sphingomonas donggukensis]|uniref:YkgJ family cysteine cluster protein n=1 Tax=Sphingomonas donggukensis TaxID=2949093 RepID=A0ABY4TTZ9_9SPHN|nr:YkgJ family cysteine cluster protein [Sphingomonas donggukensis]URW75325.1 YkgJ family cysteine cluster protein [Sphingomonas donggukensis]
MRRQDNAVPDEDSGQPDDAARLCVECGLCCNGALFTHAKLEPSETDRAPSSTTTPEGGPAFHLPCPLLTDAGCSIYETRFGICRSFRCALLRRVTAGEVGIDEGLARVAEAKRLIARATDGAPTGATIAERLRLGPPTVSLDGDGGSTRTSAQQYLASVAVDMHLDRHFRIRNKRFGMAS